MKKHWHYIDFLRVLACFLVIANHTVKDSFIGYNMDFSATLGMAYLTFSKIAVPIFLMISGALLFEREEDYLSVWKKRFLPLAAVIIFFSLFVYIFIEKREFSLISWVASMIHEPAFVAYWYLYTLMGIYVMLPILQKLVHALKETDFKYLLTIWFVIMACLPFLGAWHLFPFVSPYFVLPVLTPEIGFLFLGYYLTHIQENRKPIRFYAIVLCVTMILCYFYNIFETKHFGSFTLLLDRACVWSSVILAICVFQIVYQLYETKTLSIKFNQIMYYIGETTFGIYLIHGITLWLCIPIQTYLLNIGNRLLGVVLYSFVIFAFSFILVRLLAIIPLFKRLFHVRGSLRLFENE